MNYNWNWAVFFQTSPDGVHTYLATLILGTGWTLATALAAWCLALVFGSIVGVIRTTPHPWLVRLGNAYVELFRDIPLLVQMFLWYFVLPELLPADLGDWLKQLPNASFYTAVVALGFYTSARVAEQVRAVVADATAGSHRAEERAVARLHAACVDLAGREEAGTAPIADELSDVAGADDLAQLLAVVGRRQREGVTGLCDVSVHPDADDPRRWSVHVFQAGLSLPTPRVHARLAGPLEEAAVGLVTEAGLDPAIAARLKRTPDGLVCAVVQQAGTREVLMVAWMDDEALHRTLTTGRATYWSRSRENYWVKGDTSGHVQHVREVRLDCDGDALLVVVDQTGAACHTGDRTCFDADVLLSADQK